MKKTVRLCDRCGKEIKDAVFPVTRMVTVRTTIIFGFGGYSYTSGEQELCPDCTKSFEKWMEAQNG